jgi:hypothetical protein
MSAVVPMSRSGAVVSRSKAQQLERHGLPAALAYSLPASIAEALSFRKVSPEYETAPVAGLEYVRVELGGDVPAHDLALALEGAREAMRPGLPSDCLLATARLRAVARHRPTITSDEKLALSVYASKLARYPADAVAAACERWLELSPYWPSISELLKMCEWAMAPRRALALELHRKMPEQPYTLEAPHA